ncbi:MAG: hypothetical protein J6R64_03415, partial [Lentisphaeria bacterium]|nr:hypothetical protein [Lentisphaeria bacterium]
QGFVLFPPRCRCSEVGKALRRLAGAIRRRASSAVLIFCIFEKNFPLYFVKSQNGVIVHQQIFQSEWSNDGGPG